MTLTKAPQFVFSIPPENFNPNLEVVACFIKVGDVFLFLKRHPLKQEGSTWGVPAGKVLKGESLEKALLREILEETTLNIASCDLKYLGKVFVVHSKKDIIYHMFETTLEAIPFISLNSEEHTDFRWMTLEESLTFNLIPGEDECIFRMYGIRPILNRRGAPAVSSDPILENSCSEALQ